MGKRKLDFLEEVRLFFEKLGAGWRGQGAGFETSRRKIEIGWEEGEFAMSTHLRIRKSKQHEVQFGLKRDSVR